MRRFGGSATVFFRGGMYRRQTRFRPRVLSLFLRLQRVISFIFVGSAFILRRATLERFARLHPKPVIASARSSRERGE